MLKSGTETSKGSPSLPPVNAPKEEAPPFQHAASQELVAAVWSLLMFTFFLAVTFAYLCYRLQKRIVELKKAQDRFWDELQGFQPRNSGLSQPGSAGTTELRTQLKEAWKIFTENGKHVETQARDLKERHELLRAELNDVSVATDKQIRMAIAMLQQELQKSLSDLRVEINQQISKVQTLLVELAKSSVVTAAKSAEERLRNALTAENSEKILQQMIQVDNLLQVAGRATKKRPDLRDLSNRLEEFNATLQLGHRHFLVRAARAKSGINSLDKLRKQLSDGLPSDVLRAAELLKETQECSAALEIPLMDASINFGEEWNKLTEDLLDVAQEYYLAFYRGQIGTMEEKEIRGIFEQVNITPLDIYLHETTLDLDLHEPKQTRTGPPGIPNRAILEVLKPGFKERSTGRLLRRAWVVTNTVG